jgi:hypothetical protein
MTEAVATAPMALPQSEIDDLTTFAAKRDVLQWQPEWVDQDNNRPVILNPFPNPIQIVYSEDGDPRTVTLQPSTRTVLDFIKAATSLTVMVFDAVGQLTDVAVTTAFIGQPPESIPKVDVLVDSSDGKHDPFVVNQVTDLGEDPTVGERKVLLDGVTPVWGHWTERSQGNRQFVVTKTQQLPGIDKPAEGTPPGYQLLSDDEPLSSTDVWLIVLAALIAAVAVGATVHRVIRRKHAKRREQQERHEHPDTRVEARSRPGSTLAFSVRETPEHGETTHAVRLATHSHPGTLTINEVNDDHTPA